MIKEQKETREHILKGKDELLQSERQERSRVSQKRFHGISEPHLCLVLNDICRLMEIEEDVLGRQANKTSHKSEN